MVHLPFWPGYKQILRQLLVLRILVVSLWHPLLLLPSFVTLMILALWILHKSQNHHLQCHLGVRLGLYLSEIGGPTPNSWDDRCPLTTQNVRFCFFPCLGVTSFLFLTFVSCHAGIFSSLSHSLSTAAFASGMFIAWGIGIKKSSFHTLPRRFVGFNDACVFCLANTQNASSFPVTLRVGFCKALQLASELPTFYAHFSQFPRIPHPLDQWSKYLANFWHCQASVFR